MTVDAAENTSQDTRAPAGEGAAPVQSRNGKPILIEPDLDFIDALRKQGRESFEKCFQCGTCSATCALSPDRDPFPRKEMIWAGWGMKDRLLTDPDIWLCYQCHDCTTRCPRGARPGDVLAAIRQECVTQFSFPRFLGRWVNQPQYLPLMLAIPAVLLGLALALKGPLETALGMAPEAGERIVYSYSSVFPHWLLNIFFFTFSILVLLVAISGVVRFWRAMKSSAPQDQIERPARGLLASILTALKSIITHDDFAQCTKSRPRMWSHLSVFFGFAALTLVTLWVITAKHNPLVQDTFIYPFGFWNPWKLLANVGGIAVLGGCLLMIGDRVKEGDQPGANSYSDWTLIGTLMLVVLTGFFTEVLHYVRLEPHRHLAYFVHLMFVFTLLIYLPYSKFAHLIYRTTAIVFAEYIGRTARTQPTSAAETRSPQQEVESHAG